MKRSLPLLLVSILFLLSNKSFAQPSNDEPCNAIFIAPTNTCTYATFTNAAATATAGVPTPTCSNYAGGDVWFKTVVPCTGTVKMDSQTGVVTDGGAAFYSGTCGSLTQIACDDDASPNGLMPMISQTGLNPGDTIYIRFWEYGNDNPGTFGICISIPPPAGPGANCSTASPFCTGTVYNFPNNTNIPSLGSGGIYGCLFSTPNPVFYYFQIQNSGPLDIHIVQTGATGNALDVDFACWGPFPDLASSCGGLQSTNIVDCSYSTSNDETCNIPMANAGEYYVLLLTNYSNQVGSINFQQNGGTASTNCNVICNINATNTGPVCPGQTFNLNSTLGGAIYSWIGPDCFTSTVQNPTGVTAPTTPGTYTYTVFASTPAGENCVATTTLTVGGLPDGLATPVNTMCPEVNNGSITVTPSSPDTYTYTLNPGNITQNNNPVFTGLAPGLYTITFTNPIGCSGSADTTVVAGPRPTITTTTINTTCPNVFDGSITVNPPATGSPFSYTLTPGNITQNGNPVFGGLAPGLYTITMTDGLGCVSNPVGANIIEGLPAIATASTTPTSCVTVSDGTIAVNPPTSGGPFVYTLNPGNVVQNNNPLFTGLAAGTYNVTFTSSLGCGGRVNPDPIVAAGPQLTSTTNLTDPPCSNINDGVITVIPSAAGTYTYVLNPGGPGEVTQVNNPTFTGLAPGTYNYSFTNPVGCSGTGTITLTTHAPINTTVSLTMPLCNGGNDGIVSLVPSGGVSPYEVSIDGGANWQSSTLPFNVSAGTYTITIKDNVGCTKDTIITMLEPTLLTAAATSTPGTCNGNDGHIQVTGIDGTPGYTYSIDNGATYQPSPDFTVSGGNFPDILVQDANGCIAHTSVTVILIDNMVVNPVNDTFVCVGSTIRLVPNFSTEAAIFNWSTIPDASLISTLNNANIQTPDATPPYVTPGTNPYTEGPRYIDYVVHAVWGVCSREDTIRLNILHKPTPYAGVDMTVCNYKRDTILVGSAIDSSGPLQYNWTPANSCSSPNQSTTIATPDSTQIYTLTVTDTYGCNFSVTDQVKVFVQPPVPAFAGNDTIVVRGVPQQLHASGGVNYAWWPTAPVDDATTSGSLAFNSPYIYNPYVSLSDDQQFICVVTDAEGCLGVDTVFVRVYDGPCYRVPNAFTPNGDGINDVFRAVPVGIIYTDWFKIYNRSGQLMFQTNQWLKGWDGTYKGVKQPSGTYVWMVKGKAYKDPAHPNNPANKETEDVMLQGTVILINN